MADNKRIDCEEFDTIDTQDEDAPVECPVCGTELPDIYHPIDHEGFTWCLNGPPPTLQ